MSIHEKVWDDFILAAGMELDEWTQPKCRPDGSMHRSVGSAETIKTWRSRTIGLALPRPTSGALQRMFLPLGPSQVSGGFALGAVPLAYGLR